MKIAVLVSGLFILTYFSIQEKTMDDIFYYTWFSMGSPENKYKGEFPIERFKESAKVVELNEIQTGHGYRAVFANRLRNGNSYMAFKVPKGQAIKFRKVNDRNTKGIYNCGNKLLLHQHGSWTLTEEKDLKKIKEGNCIANECSFYCNDSSFYFFDNTLRNFSDEGEYLNNIGLTFGSDIKHHEIAKINDWIVSAGFFSKHSFGDALPGHFKSAGQLESFFLKDVTPFKSPSDIQGLNKSNLLAFVEENTIVPVYLDSFIVQPLTNMIALLSYDLKIVRVIKGEFIPLNISAGKNSVLYMSAREKDQTILLAFDIEGNIKFKKEIPEMLGISASPVLVGSDNSIYYIGKNGIASFNEDGEQKWEKFYTPGERLFALIYDDVVTISTPTSCSVYNNKGDLIFSISGITGINTPLISSESGRYFLGSADGMYELTFESK